jgi:hypothetical protein
MIELTPHDCSAVAPEQTISIGAPSDGMMYTSSQNYSGRWNCNDSGEFCVALFPGT